MQILDEWIRDIPQQFQGKPKIEVLFRAFAKQLEELNQVYNDLVFKTDIDTADGIVLDDVGSIVTLNRKEAGLLTGMASGEPIISDERYRKMLKYKVLLNTNSCTYDDIMDGIQFFYNGKVRFVEDPTYPANFFLKTAKLDIEESDDFFNSDVIIKASGVSSTFEKSYLHECVVFTATNVGVTFRIGFFPRANTELLLLDGNWFLDGNTTLDGYKEEFINCYPSYGNILMRIANMVRPNGSNHFLMGVAHEETVYHAYTRLLYTLKNKISVEPVLIEVGSYFNEHLEYALFQNIFGKYFCKQEADVAQFIIKGEVKNKIVEETINMKLTNCIKTFWKVSASESILEKYVSNQKANASNCNTNGGIKVIEKNSSSSSITNSFKVKTDVNVYLTVNKDLWYLDGSTLLDGSNGMAADIIDYGLI